tara:strand:+ start:38 stop:154 length:117 start_codon:yes stop_codon:yes gene_type:complete
VELPVAAVVVEVIPPEGTGLNLVEVVVPVVVKEEEAKV